MSGPATTTRARRRRSAEVEVEDVASVEEASARLRAAVRDAVGVVGAGETPSMSEIVRTAGVSWYPLLALSLLVMADGTYTTVLGALSPEVSATLGAAAVAGALTVKTLLAGLFGLRLAVSTQRQRRRGRYSVFAGFGFAAVMLLAGLAGSGGLVSLLVIISGAAVATVAALHLPLLLDTYPPAVRVRSLAAYQGASTLGATVGVLVVGLGIGLLSLNWRGTFLVTAAVCLIAAVYARRLSDPGFGRWDTQRVRAIVRQQADDPSPDDGDAPPRFAEVVRRLSLIPTVRSMLTAYVVLGMLLIPFSAYLSVFLQDRWGMDRNARLTMLGIAPVLGLTVLVVLAKRGEQLFRRAPGRLVQGGAVLMAAAAAAIAVASIMPVFVIMVVLLSLTSGLLAAVAPVMTMATLPIVPARTRPHLAAGAFLALTGVGGFAGTVLASGADRRFGSSFALASLILPALIVALILRNAAKTIDDDLDHTLDGIVEEEELRELTAQGRRVAMIACRHIDFSYGQLQVLFDVDFTVDEGAMIGLLGTNGAGKSTLLRVVSGLGFPSRGTVRFEGTDITFLNAERRMRLGILQVPGGRAVFNALTVADNLKAYGYSLGRDASAVRRGVDATFEAFPRLAERRNSLAAMLSGGEQQMLGLARAFMLKPRILVIDELSLGLAPIIVGELLESVRRINAQGSAVVLVEQSVNLALNLVDHAYFMEKGEIRFDGPAKDLLDRPDLLRSVFLEGAAKSLTTATNRTS